MTQLTSDEKAAILEDVLELMDACARKLRSLDDPRLSAYCLADFEGRKAGWLGHFVRDILEETLEAERTSQEDDG